MKRRYYENGLLVREEFDSPQANPTYAMGYAVADLNKADAALELIKSVEEHRVTIGVAYPANMADANMAKDGHTDFASAETVEKIAWRWMKQHQQLGLVHQEGTEGHGVVVESGIHRGPDWIVKAEGGEIVVREGDWVLGVQWDEPVWQLIKSGKLTGFSPQGTTLRRTPSPEALANLRQR